MANARAGIYEKDLGISKEEQLTMGIGEKMKFDSGQGEY